MNHIYKQFETNRLVFCGLVYQRGGNAPQGVMDQYQSQRSRGKEGFGFLEIGSKVKRRRFKNEAETFYNLGKTKANDILFHHRIPTSTDNEAKFNHPIHKQSNGKNYYLIHNGIINNADELQSKHAKMAMKYETLWQDDKRLEFNDSESLLHEMVSCLESKSDIACRGSIAFIMLESDQKNQPIALYFGRNSGNPLHYSNKKGVLRIASELEGKKVKEVKKDTLYRYDYKTDKITTRKLKIGDTGWGYLDNYGHYSEAEARGYSGHMQSEFGFDHEDYADVFYDGDYVFAELCEDIEREAEYYEDNKLINSLLELQDGMADAKDQFREVYGVLTAKQAVAWQDLKNYIDVMVQDSEAETSYV